MDSILITKVNYWIVMLSSYLVMLFVILFTCSCNLEKSKNNDYASKFSHYLESNSLDSKSEIELVIVKSNLFIKNGRVPLKRDYYYTERIRYCITNDMGGGSSCLLLTHDHTGMNKVITSSFRNSRCYYDIKTMGDKKTNFVFQETHNLFRGRPELESNGSDQGNIFNVFGISLEADFSRDSSYFYVYGTDNLEELDSFLKSFRDLIPQELEDLERKHLE